MKMLLQLNVLPAPLPQESDDSDESDEAAKR